MTLNTTFSRITSATLLTVLLFGISLFANARPAAAASLVSDSWTACPQSARNSGGNDAAGRVYIACGGNKIAVYSTAGAPLQQVSTSLAASDVAASSDGRYLYTANGNNAPRRLNRQADGSYVNDAGWRLASYPLFDVQMAPRGHFIDTDMAGNVYLADGSYTEGVGEDGVNRTGGTMSVIKYTAAGELVTKFGDWGRDLSPNHFLKLDGIAVAHDGSSVYAADTASNSRILRFDRQSDGTYGASPWRLGNSPSNGDCIGSGSQANYAGTLASPYDLDIDSAGRLWILNTTCHEVAAFTTNGTLIASLRISNDATNQRPHGFAVARDGSRVFVAQSNKIVRDVGLANGSTQCGGSATCNFSDPVLNADLGAAHQIVTQPVEQAAKEIRIANVSTRKFGAKRRIVTVRIACERDGGVSLKDGKGRRLAGETRFACQGASAQVQFVLSAKRVKQLKAARGKLIATATSGASVAHFSVCTAVK